MIGNTAHPPIIHSEVFMVQYYLLIPLSQTLLGLATFTEKLFAKKSGGYIPNNLLYSAGIAICSLFIYSVMAGFNLTPDSEILGYAAIYGMLYALSMTCIFTAYKHINMIVYSVFGKSSAIIVCIIGIAFLGDTPSATTIISVCLLFASILLPLLSAAKEKKGGKVIVSILLCLSTMLIGTGVSLTVKGFTSLASYTPERASAFYFYANIFTFIYLLFAVLITTRKPKDGVPSRFAKGIGLKATFLKVNPRLYILVPIVATVANIPTVLNTVAMRHLDFSVYTVISGALALLVLFCISKFIFKEKSTPLEIAGLIISSSAGIIACF